MSAHPAAGSLLGFLGMWSLMLTAMMAPLLICPLRHLGARSLPRRRARARLLFLAAYAAIWTLAGLLLLAIARGLDRFGPAVPAALVAAALWQFSPIKQRCLNRHHTRPPVAAFAPKANLDALRYGANHAKWCIGSCWTLMLLPLVFMTGYLAVMAAVTLWIWAEQFDTPATANWRLRAPVKAVMIACALRAKIVARAAHPHRGFA